MNRDVRIVRILLVPQTILHDRSYSASGAMVEVFLLNSERCLWYDGRCSRFKNFESNFKSARHFTFESNRNRPIRI